jgi:Protein of unknown function (DUF1592)/Protein of unknown function (DUF1588)/Protein of unknown function (DUF1595)
MSLALGLLACAGCGTGKISDAPSGGSGGNGPPSNSAPNNPPTSAGLAFSCDVSAAPASTPLVRLSQGQYTNTVHDIVKFALKGVEADAMSVLNAADVSTAMGSYPPETRATTPTDRFGTYLRMNQEVQDMHIKATYDVAVAVGAELTQPARMAKVFGTCATDADATNDAACISSFLTTFGAHALRRPLTADEVTFYRGFYGTSNTVDPAAFADLVAGFLTAPQFLYLVEHGDTPVAGKPNIYTLSAYELASRLSYQYTQSMPDDALLAAAADGSLVTNPSVYAAQLDRLLADPRTQGSVDEFFFDYFKLFQNDLHNLVSLDARNDDPKFKAFAGANLPSSTLGTAMQNEAIDLARYFTFTAPGSYSDLLTTNLSFAKTPDLAAIYKIPAWDGTSPPPAFPAGQRPGFLTRAAFLTTGMVTTRPIMSGVFIRKFILCDQVPDPPANASNTPIDTSTKSTRQAVEAITQQEGTSCIACHQSLINPLGFATGNFDALGRTRTTEPLFDATGKITAQIPVDTSTIPSITAGDTTKTATAADMIALVNSSAKAHACFARNYFRFTFRRLEDVGTDGCALERMRMNIMNGNLRDAFRDVALTDEFKSRNFQ